MARFIVSLLIAIVVVGILGAIGAGLYNAGVAAGVAQTGGTAAAAAPYVYWGFHPGFFGFGFLGLLFPILFIVLIFGLMRAAFGGGRRGWGGGWHSGQADARRADRERYMADMHRRFHEGDASGSTSSGSGPSAPSPWGSGSTPGQGGSGSSSSGGSPSSGR